MDFHSTHSSAVIGHDHRIKSMDGSDSLQQTVQVTAASWLRTLHCISHRGVSSQSDLQNSDSGVVCFRQMDDIDAMFSDLLGEMDLLTQVSKHHNHLKTLSTDDNHVFCAVFFYCFIIYYSYSITSLLLVLPMHITDFKKSKKVKKFDTMVHSVASTYSTMLTFRFLNVTVDLLLLSTPGTAFSCFHSRAHWSPLFW